MSRLSSNDLGANAGGGAGAGTGPFSNITVDILQFTVAAGTPTGTYNFRAALTGTGNERRFINDANNDGPNTGGTYNITSAPTFTITVVPEPSTWAFLTLGTFACVGIVMLRRQRSA